MPEKSTLTRDLICDIAIIGGGLTGALSAFALAQAGFDTVLVDKRAVGHGSTAASTALVLYEIEVSAEKRDALLGTKARGLVRKLEQMFPRLRLRPAFAWAGTFGDTKDSLPYIGSLPASRNVLYALCYGANGTNFGMIAANLARDWAKGKRNPDMKLFALDR